MTSSHKGSCLCGAVRFTASGPLRGVIYCHCSQCRKQTGHYYAATNVADDDLKIEGQEKITWYQGFDVRKAGILLRLRFGAVLETQRG